MSKELFSFKPECALKVENETLLVSSASQWVLLFAANSPCTSKYKARHDYSNNSSLMKQQIEALASIKNQQR